ncbi:flagellar hook associated protein [Agrobacterium vitis]|uniref:Flagellin n=1 Tax=Agrobacterium vitis TaxID=373 RepID=A0A6L6VEV4_AGRVI|nr:flagellin [Agrobacterium vitis]MUZ74313.1 flagellar hook associated protein [Agrobacterium vitis]
MDSVSINSTSASALSLLSGSSKALEATQTKVATGKKVDDASDNAAYWSIATTMKSDSLSLSSAEDATALSAAVSDTAALGLEQATGLVSDIQAKLIASKAAGANKGAINDEISQLKEQLSTVTQSSSFNGQNWLALDSNQSPKVTSMVSSVGTDGSGNLAVNVTNFDTAQSVLTSKNDASDGILTRSTLTIGSDGSDGSASEYYLMNVGSQTPAAPTAAEIAISDDTSNAQIDAMIGATQSILSSMTDASAAVGATQNRISNSSDLMKDLQDTATISIGRLTDADMEEEATKLSAQSVQSQLQTATLSIANSQQKSLAQLFM